MGLIRRTVALEYYVARPRETRALTFDTTYPHRPIGHKR
jgi:hypothetical protein